jgi:hypothetical protein
MDDIQRESSREAKIESLRERVEQLEEQSARLEQIAELRQQSANAKELGDIVEAQRLYNRAWGMERDYRKHFGSADDVDLVKNTVSEICQNIKRRNSMITI